MTTLHLVAVLNVVEAWNQISWADAIPFILILIGLYWVKVKIDSTVGFGKKGKQLKRIIREAIDESELIDRLK
tara:strand:- start:370 stop:588 length:219 start_codon:yes stop_codon:yes gene_type:complete